MIQYSLFETANFYWLIGFGTIYKLYYDLDLDEWIIVELKTVHVHTDASNKIGLANMLK